MNVFLLSRKNPCSEKNNLFPSIDLLTKWTNLKAVLSGVGERATSHGDCKRFMAKELRQHLELYIFNCLSPSPCVE